MTPTGSDARSRTPWLWVGALAVVACAGWLPFAGRSLSPDEGGLLVVADQWAPGDSLYGDFWVDRPPVLIWIVEAAEALGGTVPLRLLGALAVVTSVVLAGVLGRLAAPGERRGMLLTSGAAAVLTATPLFGGSVVDAEVLGLPFLLAGMAALVAAHSAVTPARVTTWAALAGASGVLAFGVKQSLVDVFVMAAALLLTRHRSIRVLAGVVAGAAVTAAAALALAAARGTGPVELWDAVVVFRFDAARVLAGASQEAAGGRFADLILALVFSGAPLLVVALGLVARRAPAPRAAAVPDLRLPAYAVLVWELVVVLLGGSYWLHYLMGLVPGVVLLAAAAGQRPPAAARTTAAAYGFAGVSAVAVIGWLAVHPIERPEEPAIAFLEDRAEPGDSAVVAFGAANIVRELDLTCPYPYLWSLPVRVRDPDLTAFEAVLAASQRPTWVVVSEPSMGPWELDFSGAQAILDADYRREADLGRFTVYRLAADD